MYFFFENFAKHCKFSCDLCDNCFDVDEEKCWKARMQDRCKEEKVAEICPKVSLFSERIILNNNV